MPIYAEWCSVLTSISFLVLLSDGILPGTTTPIFPGLLSRLLGHLDLFSLILLLLIRFGLRLLFGKLGQRLGLLRRKAIPPLLVLAQRLN